MHALLHLDLSRNPGLWRCPEVLLLVLRNLPRVQKVYLDTAVSPAELGAILAKLGQRKQRFLTDLTQLYLRYGEHVQLGYRLKPFGLQHRFLEELGLQLHIVRDTLLTIN